MEKLRNLVNAEYAWRHELLCKHAIIWKITCGFYFYLMLLTDMWKLLSSDLPPDRQPLEWNTRIKIAVGAAEGLTYLHDIANPPVIYRDLKAANILLDNDFNPKLSDFGLAKLGPVGDNTHVSTRVMGTYGYCAPDYAMSGKLTLKSDVYSFGMLLLELITGRKAFDSSRPGSEQKLINWVSQMHLLDFFLWLIVSE